MSIFELAIPIVLRHEGGYVWDANDPGGETNFGISKRSYPSIDIKNLTVEGATEIYRRDFWDKYGYGKIQAQAVAAKIFDSAVNMGAPRAHTLAQAVLGVVQDGVLGPKTLGELNAMPSMKFILAYQEQMAQFYRRLVLLNPARQEFLKGWLNRAYDRA